LGFLLWLCSPAQQKRKITSHKTQQTQHRKTKREDDEREKEDEHEQDDEEGRWMDENSLSSIKDQDHQRGSLMCVIFPKGSSSNDEKRGTDKGESEITFLSLGSVFGVSFFLAFEEGASFAWETGKEDLDGRFEEGKERSWIISNHPSPWISLFNIIIKVDHQQIEKDGKFFKQPQEENH
jgi:hypothetical protein